MKRMHTWTTVCFLGYEIIRQVLMQPCLCPNTLLMQPLASFLFAGWVYSNCLKYGTFVRHRAVHASPWGSTSVQHLCESPEVLAT